MDCPPGEGQIFDALDEFIAAVEETKEILQSPTVPGRCESADLFLEKNDTLRDLRSFPNRPSQSEGDLRFCKRKRYSFDETDYDNKIKTQEKKSAGLVYEMNTLLNQLSSAASSLKDIYKRRSSTDLLSHCGH